MNRRGTSRPASSEAGVRASATPGKTWPMDAYQAIVTKRDTRSFSPEPVPEGLLGKVLQAGRMAGSAKNSQQSRVVVVTDPDARGRLAKCGRFADWVPSAPVVLVIVIPDDGRVLDVGRMAQNIMVAANGLGLASCPFTPHDQDCARQMLGLPPGHSAPLGIGMGRPGVGDPTRKPSPRIPMGELVRWGRWDATSPRGA